MRNMTINLQALSLNTSFDLLEVSLRKRYINGEVTDDFDTVYKALVNYEPIEIKVNENGANFQDSDSVIAHKHAGSPLKVSFENCIISVSPKSQYELMIRGTADKANVAKPKQA